MWPARSVETIFVLSLPSHLLLIRTMNTLSLTRQQVRQALQIPSRHFLDRGFSGDVLDQSRLFS
jgi:hypothetical protein